jgi:hypothetical protein
MGVSGLSHVVEHPLRGGGSDPLDQLHQPETRDAIARVLSKAQQRQYVLDMGGIQEFEAPEFHEGILRLVSSTSRGPL